MHLNSWVSPEPDVDAFLDAFDRRGDATPFGERFLALDPHRAVVTDRAALAAALPARRAMFTEAGIGPIHRKAAAQLDLDHRHLLVTVDWAAPRGDTHVTLESTFLLRREQDRFEILVYLNHRDLAELLAQ